MSVKFPYEKIKWAIGSDNIGGMAPTVWFAPITAIKKLPDYGDDGVTRSGTIEMEKDTCFVEIYATYGTASLKSSPQGKRDCKSFKIEGEFFHPGNEKSVAKFARACLNTPGVLIMSERAEGGGGYIMIGDLSLHCTVSSESDLGKEATDPRGYTFKFEADSTRQHTFFEGEIPTAPAL